MRNLELRIKYGRSRKFSAFPRITHMRIISEKQSKHHNAHLLKSAAFIFHIRSTYLLFTESELKMNEDYFQTKGSEELFFIATRNCALGCFIRWNIKQNILKINKVAWILKDLETCDRSENKTKRPAEVTFHYVEYFLWGRSKQCWYNVPWIFLFTTTYWCIRSQKKK